MHIYSIIPGLSRYIRKAACHSDGTLLASPPTSFCNLERRPHYAFEGCKHGAGLQDARHY